MKIIRYERLVVRLFDCWMGVPHFHVHVNKLSINHAEIAFSARFKGSVFPDFACCQTKRQSVLNLLKNHNKL